jgi:hypothetical protein
MLLVEEAELSKRLVIAACLDVETGVCIETPIHLKAAKLHKIKIPEKRNMATCMDDELHKLIFLLEDDECNCVLLKVTIALVLLLVGYAAAGRSGFEREVAPKTVSDYARLVIFVVDSGTART